uniref:Tartrate-resistant acid phosphatase type 5 n=1 Tax=Globodera pallida TaxID=36090 RepID=A0A183C9Y4_GLOPA
MENVTDNRWNSTFGPMTPGAAAVDECVEIKAYLWAQHSDVTSLVPVMLLFGLIYTTIIVTSILGNLLVIFSVCQHRSLQSVRNIKIFKFPFLLFGFIFLFFNFWFIVSLSVSDIVVSVVSGTITPINAFSKIWLFGELLCKLVPVFQVHKILNFKNSQDIWRMNLDVKDKSIKMCVKCCSDKWSCCCGCHVTKGAHIIAWIYVAFGILGLIQAKNHIALMATLHPLKMNETNHRICNSETDFICLNGQCIHKVWQCNGKNDCDDGSDERLCTSINSLNLTNAQKELALNRTKNEFNETQRATKTIEILIAYYVVVFILSVVLNIWLWHQFVESASNVAQRQGPNVDPNYNPETCRKSNFDKLDKLTFFIIGDMGGSSIWQPVNPYTTHAQRSVAAAMKILAKDEQPQFVVNLGDNFYWNGVREVKDGRFESTFENVYDKPLLDVPWYPILGNHDRHGSAQAQIDYTQRTGSSRCAQAQIDYTQRTGSSRWTFPAESENKPWYKVKYEFGSTSKNKKNTVVEFLMIDTVLKCGETEDIKSDSYLAWIFHESNKNPKEPLPGKDKFAKEQDDWLKQSIEQSNANYLFVAGHYPMYSVGKHGFYNNCLTEMDQLMRKNKVTAYLSGHDHNLQHLQLTQSDGNAFDYIISGAGAATDRSQEHWEEFNKAADEMKGKAKVLLHFPSAHWWLNIAGAEELLSWTTGGFIQAQVTPDKIVLNFYSGQGSVCLDQTPIIGSILGKLPIVNQNCKSLYGSTTLCPRDKPKCRDEAPTQDKTGWFSGPLWCLKLC